MKVLFLVPVIPVAITAGILLKQYEPDRYSEQQEAHAKGHCGALPIGTGLLTRNGIERRGWVVSMIPGKTLFRMTEGNVVPAEMEMNDQHMQFITANGKGTLEWKPFGANNWEPVPSTFLYPAVDNKAQWLLDQAIKNNTVIPGMDITPEEMKDPKRIVPWEETPVGYELLQRKKALEKLGLSNPD